MVFDEPHFVSVFPIATPAARVSHSTPGSLPTTSAQILTVIFCMATIRAAEDVFMNLLLTLTFCIKAKEKCSSNKTRLV
jgi:hypothetical protein